VVGTTPCVEELAVALVLALRVLVADPRLMTRLSPAASAAVFGTTRMVASSPPRRTFCPRLDANRLDDPGDLRLHRDFLARDDDPVATVFFTMSETAAVSVL
jgi:hypothetical protein